MAVSISVGKRFEKLADYLISIGRFENRSEVFRHAMRLLEEDEYGRGYIHQSDKFSFLFSGLVRLRDLQREKEFPSARTKWGSGGEFSSEILAIGQEVIDNWLEAVARRDAGASPAKYDPPLEPAPPNKRRQVRHAK